MKTIALASALALLLEPSLAFYPYTFADSTPQLETRSTWISRKSFILPLQKVKVKRNNAFRIVYAGNPSSASATGINQDGADLSYMVTLQFGSTKKSMNMLLDSAAINMWVMSGDCTTAVCAIHNTFGVQDSTSLKKSNKVFEVTYGSGSVSGPVATDAVTFLGKSFDMTFGLAANISTEFASFPMDGICGMGRLNNVASNPSGVGAPTLMDALASNGAISAKSFSIRLSRSADGLNNGEISFGAPDTGAYEGSLNYITTVANPSGFWEVPIDSAGMNGKSASISSSATILVDSGTSYMLLPPSDAEALHATIPGSTKNGQENYFVPCGTTDPITFVLGGKPYNIEARDWIGGKDQASGNCNSLIVGRQTFGDNQWLVGDIFLKNVYSVFDYDGNRMGFGYLLGTTIPNATNVVNPTSSSSTVAPGATSTAHNATNNNGSPKGTSKPTPSNHASDANRLLQGTMWLMITLMTAFLTL